MATKLKSKPTVDDVRRFTSGGCPEFAFTLARLTGWQMVAFLHPTSDSFVSDYRRFESGDRPRRYGDAELRRLAECRTAPGGLFDFEKIWSEDLFFVGEWSMYHVYCLTPGVSAWTSRERVPRRI